MSNQALVVGQFVDGDVNVERFQAVVRQLDYALEKPLDYSPARRKLDARAAFRVDGERDLVLFCVGPELRTMRDYLQVLRADQRQIIVYAHPSRASPHIAVEYCHCGYADDFLVWGERVSGSRIDDHVKALHQKRSPYPRIDIRYAAGSERRVFIATPYDMENRMVMSDAVDQVLEKVNLIPCWADAPYRDVSVPDQVRLEIARSSLLIANIRQGFDARHNANVYYEAGQATALGIPVIFVRPVEEKDLVVPADITERRRIEYDNPIDLSMRLYRGLRDE